MDTNSGIIDANVIENQENLDFANCSTNGFVQPPKFQELEVELLQESDRKKQEDMNLYKGLVYLERIASEENCSTKEEKVDLDKLLS